MTPFETVNRYYKYPERIDPHPLQVETINDLAVFPNAGMWLDMGCVDSETEYLSPTGWVPISEYDGGPVAQFVPNHQGDQRGSAQFVEPLKYIKEQCDEMLVFKTSRGVDQKLTPDHRVVYVSPSGALKEARAADVASAHATAKMGWKGRFITTFSPPSTSSMVLTDAQLRLSVAVIADGHFPTSYSPCTLRVKKLRKIDRLRKLLQDAGVAFTEKPEAWEGCEGFVRFTFQAPLPGVRLFGDRFYQANLEQLRVIVDEVPHWDGSTSDDPNRGFRFFSSESRSADFVQYALCCLGVRSTVAYKRRLRDDRPDSDEYVVQAFTRSNLAYLCGCKPVEGGGFEKTNTVWSEPPTDGFKYCFTMPSSYWIARRNGAVFVTGNTGKTFCYTWIALYHKIVYGHQIVIIVPPTLIAQWCRWLREIQPALTVTEYRGTPKGRALMDLEVDVIVVGIAIFKKEYKRFYDYFQDRLFSVGIDEATMVGNIESDAHQKVYDFSVGHPQLPLTGTPMGIPTDAYALMKFSAPGEYRNLKHFNNLHVASADFYGRPTEFQNLDVLRKNILVNSKRILFEDMYPDAEEPLFDPVYYDLAPAHAKLYKKLAEEQLLLLPDGGKIDGTTANKLTHALGQIVNNWSHFSGMPADVGAASDLIMQKLTDLGDEKLVVFCHYKMTVAGLKESLKKFGVVTYNSEVTDKQKDANVQKFINDPKCRVIVVQIISGGKGLDGMQFVAHRMMFIEPCGRSRDFMQAVARLMRLGQRKKVHVMIAIANGTTQVRGFKNLLTNDSLINQVIRNSVDLRNAIYGIDQ